MMLINLQLSVEEVNEVLSALNITLVEKIKNQTIAQVQAAQGSLAPSDKEAE